MDAGIVAILAVFGVPIIAIITSHQRKMAEIKARTASGLSPEVRADLNEIKSQLADLRETTTKFDMSFDAALTRLEERVDRVEHRQNASRSNTGTEAPLRAGKGIGA